MKPIISKATARLLVLYTLRPAVRAAVRTRPGALEVRWTWDPASPEEGAFIVARVHLPKEVAGLLGDTDEERSGKPVFFVYFINEKEGRLVYNHAFGPQTSWKACGSCRSFPD